MKQEFFSVKAAIFLGLILASVSLVILNGILNARYETTAVSKQPGMDAQHDVLSIQTGEKDGRRG